VDDIPPGYKNSTKLARLAQTLCCFNSLIDWLRCLCERTFETAPVSLCDIITEKQILTGYTEAIKKNKEGLSMKAININNSNFRDEVMNSEKKVLLDFWAPWCGPCRMVVPIVEEIAKERPDIKVGKINVDENPELAARFGIMSIPTLVVMENGRIAKQAMGARPKDAILAML